MLNWNEYRDRLFGRVADLIKSSPDTVAGYQTLSAAGKKTARLGDKTRDLISLAVAVTGTAPSLRSCAASLRASLLVLFLFGGAAIAQESHTVKLQSPYSFTETLTRLRTTLNTKGMTVFATIDHRAAAHAVGLDMPPTTVLIFGNPKSGTPLMLAAPDFALDLPLRVLVREDAAGRTWLVYDTAAAFEGRHGLPAGMAERLAPAEKLLEAAIRAPAEH
jgi:uncharacterized protein (DUF302 family)